MYLILLITMKITTTTILFLLSWRCFYCKGFTTSDAVALKNEVKALNYQGERRAQMDDDGLTVEEELALEDNASSSSSSGGAGGNNSIIMMNFGEINSSISSNITGNVTISNNSFAVPIGDNIVSIGQPQNVLDVTIEENTGSAIITTSNSTIVLTEDEETGEISNVTFVILPSPKCSALGWVCIPTSRFHHFEEFNRNPKDLTEDEREAVKAKYIDYMVKQLHMFITGLNHAIATALVDQYDIFHNAPFMVVTLDGESVHVNMYAIGLVVEDIADIDYAKGVFTGDMRVYVFQAHVGTFNNLGKAQQAAWVNKNESSVLDHGDFKYQILRDEYLDVRETVDLEDLLIADGRCNDETIQTMKPIPMNGFNKDYFRILSSTAALTPIPDADDNLLYLAAKGAKIKFQPVNSQFFPFQVWYPCDTPKNR